MTTRPAASSRALTAAAAALALVLAAAACTTTDAPVVPPTKAGLPAATAAAHPGRSPPSTRRSWTWTKCGNLECADLRVPLDYATPDPAKDLRSRSRGSRPATRPSGSARSSSTPAAPAPPASSTSAAAPTRSAGRTSAATTTSSGSTRAGSARSAPVNCLSDKALDRFLAADPTPDDAGEEQALLTQAKAMADGCQADNPELVKHLSTVDAARDMDILRAAVGDTQLNYLGKSYGTFLGSTYAGLFPQRVGRVVLDGVVPPDLTSAEVGEGQARGFQMATKAYIDNCVVEDCPLGGTPEAALKGLDDFFRQVDRQPLPIDDPSAPLLTEGWARLGVAVALYDQGAWGVLTDALREAKSGNGQSLMQLADAYAQRRPGGGYDGNLMESIFAVNCLDRPGQPRPVRVRDVCQGLLGQGADVGREPRLGDRCRAACGR